MKKAVGLFFFVAMVSVTSFAEFVISPSIGFSNVMTKGKAYLSKFHGAKADGKYSWTPFTFALDTGYISQGGFTFMFNHNLSLGGKIKHNLTVKEPFSGSYYKGYATGSKVGGICWNGNLLAGYTYRGVPNLHITFALGFFGTAGKVTIKSVNFNMSSEIATFLSLPDANGSMDDIEQPIFIWGAGVPIHLSAQYYFTKNIGINVAIVDSLGYGGFWPYRDGTLGKITPRVEGFTNQFTLKIGPAFKL